MRQVLCPVVVGRDEELGLLAEAVEAVSSGRGGALFVLGEAGIGKSRLTREAVQLGERLGVAALVGRAVEAATAAPFRPLTEAVLSAVRRHGLPHSPELEPFRGALGRLVPHWREPGIAATVDESPAVLGEGVLRLLRTVAGAAGCLLVLEDLHWADPETLAVVE